jgi:hypothetical protein
VLGALAKVKLTKRPASVRTSVGEITDTSEFRDSIAVIVAKRLARRNGCQSDAAEDLRRDVRRSAKTSVRAALVMAATAACLSRRSTEMA